MRQRAKAARTDEREFGLMGLFQKRNERDVVSGIEIIERSDVPGDLPESDVDLVSGASAEDIAADPRASREPADDEGVDLHEDSASVRPDPCRTPASDAAPGAKAAAEAGGDGSERDEPANPYVGVPIHHEEGRIAPEPTAQVRPASDPREIPEPDPAPAPEDEPATLDDAIPDDLDEADGPAPTGSAGDGGGTEPAGAVGPEAAPVPPGRPRGRKTVLIGIAAAVLLIILIGAGVLVLRGFGSKGIGTPTLKGDQLDTTVATYRYNGQSHDISARSAIESQYSLDTAKNTDGTYTTPQAETILSYVRNQILTDAAKSRKLKVSDDEMKEYAQSKLGISDFSEMATRYGVSKDQAKEIIRDNVLQNKLYKKIVGKASSDASMPDAPSEPADGKDTTASKEYADYIIKLAGEEWDASKNTWASDKGPYHTALKDQQFTADSATYAQAMTAYYVAYQQYNESTSSASQKWKSFINDMYAKADITFYGIDQ